MNASFHHAPTAARPPLSRFVSNGLRLEVESVGADAVHVRMRPAAIAAGITDGPRVALSLSCADAHVLSSLLAEHAAGGVSCFGERRENLALPIEAPRASWSSLLDSAADALLGRSTADSESLSLELRAIAEALRVEVQA